MIIFHKEYAIGVKKLSNAELNREDSPSAQTHIGLSDKVFSFLPAEKIEKKGILAFNADSCSAVECLFSKIKNERSTKIDSTTSNPIKSVVKQIRNIASDASLEWLLVWFALEDETPVFWLINSKSEEYSKILSLVDVSSMKVLTAIQKGDKNTYYELAKLVRSLPKLNNFIKITTSHSVLIAQSAEVRTFVHLCLDYFDANSELDRMLPYFSTQEQNSPIKVEKENVFCLQNMFMFADKNEIAKRNEDRTIWYTFPYNLNGRNLYLYVDWYADAGNFLSLPDFIKMINASFGGTFQYKKNGMNHELWLKRGTDWIFPSNESKYRLTKYFEDHKQIDWSKGDTKCAVDDIVYVYCSGDEGRIKFKAKVIDNDVPAQDRINDKEYWVNPSEYDTEKRENPKYIRLELEGSLAEDDYRLSLNRLHELGINGSIQGRRKVPDEALAEIESVFNTPFTVTAKETKAFQMIDAVNAVKETGLIYSDLLVKRFATSLLTKPFVILSGLAGSGKTQLAIAFAKAMVENKDEQLRVVPVGADWTNREPLLGYPNALRAGEYVRPESGVLDILINAIKNPNKPYFLILDEMNLSYVERYFADFLSAMESHQPIHLWDTDLENPPTPTSIELPRNVFVIGTINVDETTYMFSPKVLDRANVIEFKVNENDMAEFLANAQSVDVDSISGKLSSEAIDFVKIASEKTALNSIANEVLKKFFSQLKTVNAEFGYRTASEIGRFVSLAKQVAGVSDNEAIDSAIVQKLLPKLHGSRKKIVPVLKELWELCATGDKIDEKTSMVVPDGTKYSLSADKILRMYQCAIENGFTSFAEA